MRDRHRVGEAREIIKDEMALRIGEIKIGIFPFFMIDECNPGFAQRFAGVLANDSAGDGTGFLVGGN